MIKIHQHGLSDVRSPALCGLKLGIASGQLRGQ